MLTCMLDKIKGKDVKIVFPEGNDERVLEAAIRLYREKILIPILLGNKMEVKVKAEEYGFNIDGIEIIDPLTYPDLESMIQKMIDLRKGKMNAQQCREALEKTNYFGTMYVAMGLADGLVGGATYSTADTVRPALQLIKTKPTSHIVSSAFILVRGDEKYVMSDCAINISPSEDDLVEIAIETANTARVFGVEPIMGLLSYSTLGSGKGEAVDKVRNATERLKLMDLDFKVDGEFQFDAAISPVVAKTKAPDSEVAGKCNTFIFPSIEAGNIGYKIAQRLGGFEACGPILQGLNAPINDLSRGCNAEEIYKLGIITAAQKYI
ncbi:MULTISPECIES: phosphate acetyltransferase [unclassified Breznakia]|uniref:phosphate acetyltransferase n=1 Tax=unclassified Breznakia TaxID=2623764 RepID=UPI0024072E4D|nr:MULTISPECIES: phosphate acetyltransferase [unclassified Breznakia]MDF9837874.1 phosphate acetyltransferase [Breznakia sp. PFB2-8]MDF9859833.1 phosphate acetyltransferase [Breznakia sp. PH5-24]